MVVSRQSYFYTGNTHTSKDCIYNETGTWLFQYFLVDLRDVITHDFFLYMAANKEDAAYVTCSLIYRDFRGHN